MLLYNKIQASLTLLRDSFKNLLKGSPNVQDALERIDDILIPATYDRDGLFSSGDKLKLDTLQEVVEDGGIGHISLTSGYGTYSFESNTVEDDYTINHKLNSYNLTITVMFMNEDGFWENMVVPITFIDENTIHIKLVEPREIIVHINAVEYFFSYTYESTQNQLVHEITHNLKSFNLLFNIIVYDVVEEKWKNDLAKFVYKDENTGILTLTEAVPCRVNFIRL